MSQTALVATLEFWPNELLYDWPHCQHHDWLNCDIRSDLYTRVGKVGDWKKYWFELVCRWDGVELCWLHDQARAAEGGWQQEGRFHAREVAIMMLVGMILNWSDPPPQAKISHFIPFCLIFLQNEQSGTQNKIYLKWSNWSDNTLGSCDLGNFSF